MGITAFTTARDRIVAGTGESLTGEAACALLVDAFALVAPAHAVAMMTTDPETNLPAGGVVRGFDPSQCVPFWDNELLDPDFNKFNSLARSIDPVATLADATDGDLARSPRFVKLYQAFGASDECDSPSCPGRPVSRSAPSCVATARCTRRRRCSTCGTSWCPPPTCCGPHWVR